VPTALLGRVSSLDWLISIGLLPLSFALTGPVSGAIGARTTLIAAGVLGAVVTFAALLLPGMRDVEGRSEERAPDEHEHDDRRHHGDDPHQRPEGLLLGAQRVEHYST
jgi:hypothetical protein